jgi:hypothetical protein
VKIRIAVLTPLLAVPLAAHAGPPSSPPQACASAGQPEYLCHWNGNTCNLDVEAVDPGQNHPCDYGSGTAASETSHLPMCFSVSNAQHIVFSSSHDRAFRPRRLVPITAGCPANAFAHAFDPNANFASSFDSQAAQSGAINCQYKLEIEFQAIDNSGKSPADPGDGKKHECHDPHLQVTQ